MEKTQPRSEQCTRKALAACSLYADTNLNILRQWTDFSASVVKESVSLYAELQSSALEAMQEGQASVLRHLSELPELPQDAAGYYQKHVRACVDSTAGVCKLLQSNAQGVLRTTEQFWHALRQTSNGIQTSYAQLADQMMTLCSSTAP